MHAKYIFGCVLLAACMGGPWIVHSTIVSRPQGPMGSLLALFPLALLAAWAAVRSRHRSVAVASALLVAAGFYWLKARYGGMLAIEYGVTHAVIYLSLLILFGRSLSSEPLVTRLARKVHDHALSPAMEVYTRKVTIAWCGFFLAQLLVSALLFTCVSRDAWSLFINVMNFPLLVAMFAAEYAYRSACFPDYSRVSILAGIQAFRQDSAQRH